MPKNYPFQAGKFIAKVSGRLNLNERVIFLVD